MLPRSPARGVRVVGILLPPGGQVGWWASWGGAKGCGRLPASRSICDVRGRISPEVTVRSYGPKSLRQVVCCGRVGWGQRLLGPGCFVWSGSRRGGRTDSPQPHSLKPPAPLLALDEEVVEVWWGWWGLL